MKSFRLHDLFSHFRFCEMLFSICMGKGKGFPPCHLAHRERRHMHACRYILYVRSINTYSISPTTVELTIRCRRQRNTEYIHVYTEIYNCCDSSTSCFALTCFAQSNASSSCIEPSCASTGGGASPPYPWYYSWPSRQAMTYWRSRLVERIAISAAARGGNAIGTQC